VSQDLIAVLPLIVVIGTIVAAIIVPALQEATK